MEFIFFSFLVDNHFYAHFKAGSVSHEVLFAIFIHAENSFLPLGETPYTVSIIGDVVVEC